MSSPSLSLSAARSAAWALLVKLAVPLIVSGAFLWLMLFRQPLYPRPWFDEGLNVSTAGMLARAGLYALPDSAGPRVMDPAIQTGPTVLVPVALAFRLLGFNLMSARLVMLAFAALLLIAYALMTRQLLGGAAAVVAVLFLIVGTREPFTSFVFMSRQVLGEVPALGFYLLGLLIWWRAVERPARQWPGLILSGLAWGAAALTKLQLVLLVPACLACFALLDRVYYRQAGLRAFVVPGVIGLMCVAAWYAVQLAVVGPEQFRRNLAVLHEGSLLHIVGLNPAHWRNVLGVIWRTGWWMWGAPGLAWGMWQARPRTWNGFRQAGALMLPIVALIWFAGLSIGWGRYAFYTVLLTPIWTAGLVVNVSRGSPQRRALAGTALALYAVLNGWPLAQNLIAPMDTGYLAMRDYLATQVPADAVIESWEWEMSLDARQPVHHPPTLVTNLFTRYMMSGQQPPSGLYDARQAQPAYILQGLFGEWTQIYRDTITNEGEPVVKLGAYALYRLRPPATSQTTSR